MNAGIILDLGDNVTNGTIKTRPYRHIPPRQARHVKHYSQTAEPDTNNENNSQERYVHSVGPSGGTHYTSWWGVNDSLGICDFISKDYAHSAGPSPLSALTVAIESSHPHRDALTWAACCLDILDSPSP